jgi:DNA-binding MarR family transcriptional regulator
VLVGDRGPHLLQRAVDHDALRPLHTGLTRPAITALVDRLTAAGLVARVPVPDDRRAIAVELRPGTWQAFAAVYRPLGERVWAATAELSERDRRTLTRTVSTMVKAFDEARAGLVDDDPERP